MTSTTSPTSTFTATLTDSPTRSATATFSPTITLTATRTATATTSATNSPSPTDTPTIVPMPNQMKVYVYNSAGEKVLLLFDGGVSVIGAAPKLDTGLINSGYSGANLNFAGQLSSGGNGLYWNGATDNGGLVDRKSTRLNSSH